MKTEAQIREMREELRTHIGTYRAELRKSPPCGPMTRALKRELRILNEKTALLDTVLEDQPLSDPR